MYWYELNRKYKLMVGFLLLLLLFMPAMYFISRGISQSGKIAVSVDIVPSDSDLTVDGQKTKAGTTYLTPGDHTIKASKAGFKDVSYTTYITSSRKTIAVTLDPLSQDAEQWAKEHQADYDHMVVVGEKAAQESGQAFNKRNPITAKLPYRTFIYTIGYQADPTDPSGNSIILTIDAPEGYRQAALYRIRQLGYDPTDFNIIFRDYENPFPL